MLQYAETVHVKLVFKAVSANAKIMQTVR